MKVSELTNEQLDYWVAKAQGWELVNGMWSTDGFSIGVNRYRPTIKGTTQTIDLIEKFDLQIDSIGDDYGHFKHGAKACNETKWWFTEDFNINICRAVIASVYGEEVPNE